MHRPNSQLVHTHVRISKCSCAFGVDAAADLEKRIAVHKRNGGQPGTDVTVIFSADLEGRLTLSRCKRNCIMVQKEAKRQKKLDSGSSARRKYTKVVQGLLLKPVHQSEPW